MDKTDSVSELFSDQNNQNAKQIQYDETVVKSQIDMVGKRVEYEPTSGSSVVIEEKAPTSGEVLSNGFPAGVGPNAAPETPVKKERTKLNLIQRAKDFFTHATKRQKIIMIAAPAGLIVLAVLITIIGQATGAFKTDYSVTYSTAKEIKNQITKIRGDVSCNKISEYASNSATSNEIYQKYIEDCKQNMAGIDSNLVTKLGDSTGVLKDPEIGRKFDAFRTVFNATNGGDEDINKALDLYAVWHKWSVIEGNKTSDWTEADILNATKILRESGNQRLKDYGEKWATLKAQANEATYRWLHSSSKDDGSVDFVEMRRAADDAKNAFNDFERNERPNLLTEFPLKFVDLAKVYAKFEELYEVIRKTYEENYNFRAGGCRELINSVRCE